MILGFRGFKVKASGILGFVGYRVYRVLILLGCVLGFET